MPNKCLPDGLKGKTHTDWKAGALRFLWWVPRSWTAWCGWAWPQPPVRLLGDSGWTEADQPLHGHHTKKFMREYGHVLPIPKAGHWLVSVVFWLKFIPLPMVAITFDTEEAAGEEGYDPDYFSLGIARWDDVDKYYDLVRARAHGKMGRVVMIAVAVGIVGGIYLGIRY